MSATRTVRNSGGLGIKFGDQYTDIRRSSVVVSQSSSIYSFEEGIDKIDTPHPAYGFTTSPEPVVEKPIAPRRVDAIDLEADPYELLEELLDSTLRDQAVTFVRKSSSTPRAGSSQFTPRVFSGTATFATGSPLPPRYQRQRQTQIYTGSPVRNHRSCTVSGAEASRIPPSNSSPDLRGFSESHYRSQSTPTALTPTQTDSHSFSTFGNRLLKKLPKLPNISKRIRLPSQIFPFFTKAQEAETAEKVYSKVHGCERHQNCTDCTNIEFAYWENKIMSTSIPADERQKIIANNKSLRTIKNELESLLENGMISDETYDTVINSLPAETSLNSAARRNVVPPSPIPTPETNPLTAAISNMRINSNSSQEPPSYSSSTAAPPALPGRAPTQQPERPEIGRATSLYPYEGAPEDCSFGVNETLVIYEYMNNEWCYGKNLTTGKQGLFPTNYVQIKQQAPTPNPNAYGAYGADKQNAQWGGGYPGQYQQAQAQGPPPPGPSNPYNSAVPPMQIAEQPVDGKPGKGAEMGKKFGKKLGNAAIFGAGATIGGNIVNSIF
ncbi:uncharacterized protein LY89DRAFT_728071 [Mollisia scopiformis]|uniref:SH3 domain-containing protein n=1 Tax=Mollisia scopiformis TaxID=149040 RepID=A0A194XT39_MOLSC|nr:uncharacterized protein LY89DRAFT_728071 [Mollisia scopiformis]KUJ23311.1 hypothetical protein LY89DRAFT_728071 [Mollisia scopiformis]